MRQGWMKKDRLGTNIKVTGIARCAWDLRTKHWLWSKHVPEKKNMSIYKQEFYIIFLYSLTQIRNGTSLI